MVLQSFVDWYHAFLGLEASKKVEIRKKRDRRNSATIALYEDDGPSFSSNLLRK